MTIDKYFTGAKAFAGKAYNALNRDITMKDVRTTALTAGIIATGMFAGTNVARAGWEADLVKKVGIDQLTRRAADDVYDNVTGKDQQQTTVNVYNQTPQEQVVARRYIAIEYWDDRNGNGKVDAGEHSGDIGNSVDMGKVGVNITVAGKVSDKVNYTILDLNTHRTLDNIG